MHDTLWIEHHWNFGVVKGQAQVYFITRGEFVVKKTDPVKDASAEKQAMHLHEFLAPGGTTHVVFLISRASHDFPPYAVRSVHRPDTSQSIIEMDTGTPAGPSFDYERDHYICLMLFNGGQEAGQPSLLNQIVVVDQAQKFVLSFFYDQISAVIRKQISISMDDLDVRAATQ